MVKIIPLLKKKYLNLVVKPIICSPFFGPFFLQKSGPKNSEKITCQYRVVLVVARVLQTNTFSQLSFTKALTKYERPKMKWSLLKWGQNPQSRYYTMLRRPFGRGSEWKQKQMRNDVQTMSDQENKCEIKKVFFTTGWQLAHHGLR